MAFSYPEVFSKLTYETAMIIFMKKNGDVRVMFGTRNLHTVELHWGFQGAALGGHDNRCNIKNGNIAVYDLMLGEARSFNIERLVAIEYLGEIRSKEELDKAAQTYLDFKNKYDASTKELTMESLD